MKPLIIAHRGASALAPENTLAAFQKAIDDGAEGIEFDVRPAKDGVPVVFHDADLKRVCRRSGRVADFTAAELATFDAGSWFNLKSAHRADERFSGETVPAFSKLLDFLRDYKGVLYVELKCSGAETPALVEAVCRLIVKNGFLPQVKLKSFNLEAIALAKKRFPEIRTVALFEPKIGTVLRGKAHFVEQAERFLADELSLHFTLATRKMMFLAKEKNIPVAVWTVDNPAWIRRAAELGVEAVITNNPARLIGKRRKLTVENRKF